MPDDLTRDLRDLSKRFVFQGGSEYANGIADEIERLRAGDADLAKTWLAKTVKIERLREENETLRAAVTDAERAINLALHAVGTLREEIERLRGLLRETVPELLGEKWQEERYCPRCYSYDGHTWYCLITRIEAALAAEEK
jgi:hypothetical protein